MAPTLSMSLILASQRNSVTTMVLTSPTNNTLTTALALPSLRLLTPILESVCFCSSPSFPLIVPSFDPHTSPSQRPRHMMTWSCFLTCLCTFYATRNPSLAEVESSHCCGYLGSHSRRQALCCLGTACRSTPRVCNVA